MYYSDRAELDKISQIGVQTYFNVDGNPVVRMHSSFYLVCERDDTAFTIPVMATGNWEAWNAVAILKDLSVNNSILIDVGANVGYYGIMSASFGIESILFEPNPSLIPLINESIRLNRICKHKIKVINRGLGQSKKQMKLYTHKNHSGANSLYGSGLDFLNVSITTLDDSISAIDPNGIYVIKVDTEGFEFQVWAGAEQFRSLTNNIWFCEWVPKRFTERENKDFLTKVLETHDLQFVTYEGGLRAIGIGDALAADFETIVFRKRLEQE